MKKTVYIIILILSAVVYSGCGKLSQVFSAATLSPTPTLMPEPTPTISIVVEETFTPAPTSTPMPSHQLGFVSLQNHDSNLCVRTGADTTYEIIGAIKHGLTVRIFTEVDDWYEVEFDGKLGYCSGDYIIIDNDLAEPLRPQYCVVVANKTSTEFRELPESGTYSVGDRVDITGDGVIDGIAVDTDKDKSADAVEIEAKDELIDVTYYCPSMQHDIDLATEDNQFKQKIYSDYYVLLQREVYKSLLQAQTRFLEDGLSIKIYDAYRPFKYQTVLYNLSGDEKMFNNTDSGSNHNRGAAVDITLVDANGKELEMPSEVHDFGPLATRDNPNMSEQAAENLEYMTSIMMDYGFTTYQYEWWHFNHINAKNYSMREYSDTDFTTIRVK